jgi:hypothetical protein
MGGSAQHKIKKAFKFFAFMPFSHASLHSFPYVVQVFFCIKNSSKAQMQEKSPPGCDY